MFPQSSSVGDTWKVLHLASLVNKRCSFQRVEVHTDPTKEGALKKDSSGVSSSARRVRDSPSLRHRLGSAHQDTVGSLAVHLIKPW